jgi:hypothetical protein
MKYDNMEVILMNEILCILKKLRVNVLSDEYTLQSQIADLLKINAINFTKEHKLGRGSRVDFLTSYGIAIEVKKGKPNKVSVHTQLLKYAKHEEITGIILVVETSLSVPHTIAGKPCCALGLQKLWGIAL